MNGNKGAKFLITVLSLFFLVLASGCAETNRNIDNDKTSTHNGSSENNPYSDIKAASDTNLSSDEKTSTNDPDVKGYVVKINGEKIVVSKITKKSNGSLVGNKKGSKAALNNTDNFEVDKNTVITIRSSSDQGKTSTDKAGTKADIQINSLVEVWCEKDGDNVIAKTVVIYVCN